MIYRHYKGGLYLFEGYVVPYSQTKYDSIDSISKIKCNANYKETLEELKILEVYDGKIDSSYYVYMSENITGILCLYKSLDGTYWLRKKDNFHEHIKVYDTNGDYEVISRFERVNGEFLFESISKLINKNIDKTKI